MIEFCIGLVVALGSYAWGRIDGYRKHQDDVCELFERAGKVVYGAEEADK